MIRDFRAASDVVVVGGGAAAVVVVAAGAAAVIALSDGAGFVDDEAGLEVGAATWMHLIRNLPWTVLWMIWTWKKRSSVSVCESECHLFSLTMVSPPKTTTRNQTIIFFMG